MGHPADQAWDRAYLQNSVTRVELVSVALSGRKRGIIWRYRTGSPWRDLPAEFGAWQSVAKRHRRWSVDGTYAQIVAAIQTGLDDARS
jgi:transposase